MIQSIAITGVALGATALIAVGTYKGTNYLLNKSIIFALRQTIKHHEKTLLTEVEEERIIKLTSTINEINEMINRIKKGV